ncbi:MAG: ECF transporter S component [Lachnospiraceae bacterium]|nr:ECF transporter S component [Lachnospiraceae bacterium]
MTTINSTVTTTTESTRENRAARFGVRYLTVTAMLSAVAFILQFFEFPIPLMPAFIKMDLSDLPGLIAAFALGPVSGTLVCLIKNLIHLTMSQTGGVGELCNFLLGAAFVLPAGLIYKFNKTKRGAMIGAFTGMLIMAACSFPINYFITYPVYELFMPEEAIVAAYQLILPSVKTLAQCLLVFNVPFTAFKALCSVVVTLLIYKKISPILHG